MECGARTKDYSTAVIRWGGTPPTYSLATRSPSGNTLGDSLGRNL